MEEFTRAFQTASPKRQLEISELSLEMYSPGAAETPLRARLAELTAPSPVQEVADATGEGETAVAVGEGVEAASEASPAE